MTRYPWPHACLLHCAELLDAHQEGLTKPIAGKVLPKGLEAYGPAVALRWSTHPALGFPRAPFTVYRREPHWKPDRVLLDKPIQLGLGLEELPIGGDELYELRFAVTPSPGTLLVAEALDAHGRPIPGQRIGFNAAGQGAMRCPGIAVLRLTGTGELHHLLGMTASALANLPDWQRIAVVGLPFKAGSLPPAIYDTGVPQGYEPPSLAGTDAALNRLLAESGLGLPPPAISDPDVPTPGWPTLDPGALLAQLGGGGGPLEMIAKCLDNSYDPDPDKQQVAFLYEHVLEGIRQVDQPLPPGSEPAKAGVPVVAITQLAVTSDSDAATALGYGMIDFPPPHQNKDEGELAWPSGHKPPPFIYMVEAEVHLPFLGGITVCALSQVRPPPPAATSLVAAAVQRNRAAAVDLRESEAVELAWKVATPPVAYVLAASRKSGACEILNAKRLAAPGYDLYVPQRPPGPAGQPLPGARTRFIDPVAPVPFHGVDSHRYFVLARDVFARWATWSKVQHTLHAPAISAPGLQRVAIDPRPPGPPAIIEPTDLTIEVAWDWSDRRPQQIVLTGRFYSGTAPASYLAGLERNQTLGGADNVAVVLTFKPDRTPIVPNPLDWEAWLISAPGEPRCLYRVVVHNMVCDFSGAHELTYAVYARGYEAVRAAYPSAVIGPRIGKVADPHPAPPPPLPEILWTALPDAANRARTLLTWTASPGAQGYFIWEATESALRSVVDLPPVPDPVPGQPSATLPERAGELRDFIAGSPVAADKSLGAFTRLNERAIPANNIELELPGATDGLYVYRISTVTPAGVESARSAGMAFVGVPRRAVPGEPSLLLRRTATGVRIYAQRGSGRAPAGFVVHRVLSPRATADVGMMGPPVYPHTSPLWQPAAATDPALRGQDHLQFKVLDDPVPARWDPYFYRIVAVGPHDPDIGVLTGNSRASALQSIVFPPADGPTLDDVAITPPSGSRVLSFRTNLAIRPCPLGHAKITVAQLQAATHALVRTAVLERRADQVAAGPTFAVIVAPTPAELAAMPEISRGAPDAQGRVVYSVRLPGAVARGAITVTDPLGRAAELNFGE